MKQNLTCFKCHKDTATLTYEENRIYKVSCPCGCEYDFEHSSMKRAEEYHYKMLELYREIDRAKQLQQENEQLKELLRLAVVDMNQSDNCDVCKFNDYMPSCDCECLKCMLECECHECRNTSHFTWQHADRLKGLVEI